MEAGDRQLVGDAAHVAQHHALEVGEVAVEGGAAETRHLHHVLNTDVAERPGLEQGLGGVEDRLLGRRPALLRGGPGLCARRRHSRRSGSIP